MLRDDSFHLYQMLEASRISRLFSQDRVRSDLDTDLMFLYALVKAVEIIGEAASHVSDGFQTSHSEVGWLDIIGMRNWLVHAYYDMNHDTVWETVQDDIPVLISQLEPLIEWPSG